MKHGVQITHIDGLPTGFADVEVLGLFQRIGSDPPASNAPQPITYRDKPVPDHRRWNHAKLTPGPLLMFRPN
jgi:hypothetical protein